MADTLLTIPVGAGRAIVETAAMLQCPLLGTNRFVKYCTDRGLRISRERLVRLERLRVFAPVFRVRTVDEAQSPLTITPGGGDISWFDAGWAYDTTTVPATHPVPEYSDQSHEAYYSIFQIHHLEDVLNALSLHVELDSYVDRDDSESFDWAGLGARRVESAAHRAEVLRTHQYRQAVALLCQQISNRYYPHARSDMRTVRHRTTSYSDSWIVVDGHRWHWRKEAPNWNAHQAADFYELTPEKLCHAFEGLALAQAHCDPIEHWHELAQFVSVHDRDRLKGDALKSETLRGGAHMLRLFYKDLYGTELRHPNEVGVTVFHHMPELEIRRDVRRHLEFVANRFGVNPQPRLSLIVEGRSEEVAVMRIFEHWLGAHPGVYGIEIIALGGVDRATGGKAARFAMIMRLVDYLHHHQTFAMLVLDNEHGVDKLKDRAQDMRSIHDSRRHATRTEYIRVWDHTFEFDNFSCAEITTALNELGSDPTLFTAEDVSAAKDEKHPGAALKALYKGRKREPLDKVRLSELLTRSMLDSPGSWSTSDRPLVRVVEQAAELAGRNHLPTTEDARNRNQESSYFGTTVPLAAK